MAWHSDAAHASRGGFGHSPPCLIVEYRSPVIRAKAHGRLFVDKDKCRSAQQQWERPGLGCSRSGEIRTLVRAGNQMPANVMVRDVGRTYCQLFALIQAIHRGERPSRLLAIVSKNSLSAGQYSPHERQRFSSPSSVTALSGKCSIRSSSFELWAGPALTGKSHAPASVPAPPGTCCRQPAGSTARPRR